MDVLTLNQLKAQAASDPKAALATAAKQLESLFMHELLKSMRATTLDSGMLDNSGTAMGTEMLDGEFAQRMSGLPGGLSQAIIHQLEGSMRSAATAGPTHAGPTPASPTPARAEPAQLLPSRGGDATAQPPSPAPAAGSPTRSSAAPSAEPSLSSGLSAAQSFVQQHQQAAQAAQAKTGLPAANILGQAALESGWGQHEIRHADGTRSHNLFGIKAGPEWKGPVAEVTTTEYVNGQARRVKAAFRAYESYEAAFVDHAKLLTNSPRYAQVVAQGDAAGAYAQGLQRAGYATDPAYADKLTRVINTTLRLQRAVS